MIHPTAIVSPDAQIGKNVEIGPYAVIEDNVKPKFVEMNRKAFELGYNA